MTFIKQHLIEIFASLFFILFVFWSIGYFANALFNCKFDLQSCWAGFQTLAGAGTLAVVKYLADTFGNSKIGEAPYKKE